ncbi:MAG: hypothetical protein ROZ00_02680 [Denitratisoma sp.]|nr:hypothetical protein [Denitratisoma sp.]
MKLYISDFSTGMLIVLYLPLVLWLLWKVWHGMQTTRAIRALVILMLAVLAYTGPLGDVTVHSVAMAKVCPTAGLHIYKKVRAEGYFDTGSGPRQIEQYGYRFIETQKPGGKVSHYERHADGSIMRTEFDQPTAEYEVVYENRAPVPELGVRSMQRWHVRHRPTGEVVGEWLAFSPMHGWLDRFLLNRWFGAGLPGCDGEVLAKYESWRQELLPPQ